MLFFCLSFFFLSFIGPDTSQLREAYKNVKKSEEAAWKFIELAEDANSSPLHQAYLGAAYALKAKYDGNKIKNLRTAKKLIEKAVGEKPNNIEIRMIRLSIQETLPWIVGYSGAVESDAQFIIENLKYVENNSLKEYLQQFIATSPSFSEAEKSLLLQL